MAKCISRSRTSNFTQSWDLGTPKMELINVKLWQSEVLLRYLTLPAGVGVTLRNITTLSAHALIGHCLGNSHVICQNTESKYWVFSWQWLITEVFSPVVQERWAQPQCNTGLSGLTRSSLSSGRHGDSSGQTARNKRYAVQLSTKQQNLSAVWWFDSAHAHSAHSAHDCTLRSFSVHFSYTEGTNSWGAYANTSYFSLVHIILLPNPVILWMELDSKTASIELW